MFYQSLQANGKTTIFVVFKHLEGGYSVSPATFLLVFLLNTMQR